MEDQDIDQLTKYYNWLIRARKREHAKRGANSFLSIYLEDTIEAHKELISTFCSKFQIDLPTGFNN